MTRIESDLTKRKEEKETEFKDGEYVEVGKKYTTQRSTVTSFTIYDLNTHRKAWAATIDGTVKESRVEKNGPSPSDKTVLDKTLNTLDRIDKILGSDEDKYPEPPSFTLALEDAFSRFVKALPKSK